MIDPRSPDYANTPASSSRPRLSYAPGKAPAPPVVTIITPFYNTGAIFHATARSVLGQSLQQWEWLIINDASTDPAARAVLEQYRCLDPRIRVLDHDTNRGLSAARNTGFHAARSDYVLQLDSDDLIEPTAAEKWCWFLESYPESAFVKGYTVGFGAQRYLWAKGFEQGKRFLLENVVDATAMIRRQTHQQVGGYDEKMRGGLEDWDFWLKCANAGQWGATIPEYLDWYRRRAAHSDRWTNWNERDRTARAVLRRRYPRLWKGTWPKITPRAELSNVLVPDELPWENHLIKTGRRLLMLLPWLTIGGADKFNLSLLQQLARRGWEVTIATTLPGNDVWLPEFARFTPDIFSLPRFLRLADYPRFLRYLIQSRQIDSVLISNSQLGYLLLPYLRAHCPNVAFTDFSHMEEEDWKNGGYPRMSLNAGDQLDLSIVASEHLKQWMVERGGASTRVEACTINVDVKELDAARYDRAALRKALNIETQAPVVLYAGRLCPQKQPHVFAEVVSRLASETRPFYCLVAGDGEARPFLERFLRAHRLKFVRMLGAVSHERMRELLAVSDIFFLPSQMEGISLAIYEAMAMGVVPVGADVGGQRELVTPECGYLIPRGEREVDAYIAALKRLIESPQLCREMGRAGRERIVAHFDLDRMGTRMEELFQQAARGHAEAPPAAIDLDVARAHATTAIKSVQAEVNLLQTATLPTAAGTSTTRQLYRFVKWLLRPGYQLAVKRGWSWVVPLKEQIRTVVWGSR